MKRYDFRVDYRSNNHGAATRWFFAYGDCEAEAEWKAVAFAEDNLKKYKAGFAYKIEMVGENEI